MTDELKPVRCGCGGEAVVHEHEYCEYEVYCPRCFITTDDYFTEAKAIEAWNRAMSGSAEEKLKAFWDGMSAEMKEERTAKVRDWSEDVFGHYRCDKCGFVLGSDYVYCPNCGARLEWE